MCGRTRCTLRPDDVPRASHRHSVPTRFLNLDRSILFSRFQVPIFNLKIVSFCCQNSYRPSYNVAPGSYIPILRRDNEVVGDGVVVHCMKWGLIPSFTKKTDRPDFFKMFNARSESVGEKASFRRLLPKNRCLVAVDGFYEWKKDGSKKQPYYIHFEDGRPMVFAALFDSWQNSGGETLYTFTILTTTSSSALNWLHDRMPVILGDKDSVDTWLDDPSTSRLQPLLSPYEKPDLVWYPVTSAIGKPTFNGPECIQQIPIKASQNSLISKFFSAKQPKIDKGDKESKSTNANIPVHWKEEPPVESCEEAVSNEAKNLCFQEIVKAEPIIEDNSAFTSHIESVKNEVEEDTYGEASSIKTGEIYNLDLPRIWKEEPESLCHHFHTTEESNQLELPHESVEEKPRNENQETVLTEGGVEKSPGKSGTKRDYEVFSAQEKPLKHSEKLQGVKSSGIHGRKQGKGKSNIKKTKETQSTLHFFFDEK